MDHGDIFVLEFIVLVALSTGVAVLLTWKTRKPAVLLLARWQS